MSVTSSTTSGSVVNSCSAPSILDRGDRRALQRREQHAAQALPSVMPKPRSSGSQVNLP